MGISLPPEVRKLYDHMMKTKGFAYGPMVSHVYCEASRYFTPEVEWIERTIKNFEDKHKHVRHFNLVECLEAKWDEPWNTRIVYRWVNTTDGPPSEAPFSG